MTMAEYIKKLEAAQDALPEMLAKAAENATIRAVEAAQDKTPPTADDLSGTNTRTGELQQRWADDSQIKPEVQGGDYITRLRNSAEYASYVNDGHRMDKHFVPGLYVNDYTGQLEYDPNKDVGMMVGTKTSYVEGLHMTDAGTEAYQKTLESEMDAIDRKIRRMLE